MQNAGTNKLPLIKKMKRGLNLIAWSPFISYRSLQSPDTQNGSGSEIGREDCFYRVTRNCELGA